MTNRDHARAWLPETLDPGCTTEVPIEISTPDLRGRYTLKFDLVIEGIDWLEAGGSETTTKSLMAL